MEKFYWLKLKRDFFKRHDIKIIESMPNGKDYILFYLKLLCESVDHNGNLRFSDEIPYNEDMLSVITNTNIDIVRSAIKIFTQLNMMEMLDDGTYFMSEVNKMIGSAVDSDNANRQRRFRERQKELALQNVTECVTKNNESKNIDIEIDKEEKKEIYNKEKKIYKKYGEYQRVKLTDKEYDKLINDFGENVINEVITNLDAYVESNNNKNKYSNYNIVIRRAIREEWFKKENQPVRKEVKIRTNEYTEDFKKRLKEEMKEL